MSPAASLAPRPAHLTRLKSIWRSAGWPCRDAIELDLIAAAWVTIERDGEGRETLHLTDDGMRLLVETRQKRSRGATPHDRLAARVCAHLAAQGRIAWRELALRAQVEAPLDERMQLATPLALDLGTSTQLAPTESRGTSVWRMARPDVFSIRNTSVEHYLHPVVHEIKTSRADLLCDLRNPAKREAYRWLSCETYYVYPEGLAEPDEIPAEFGVLTVDGSSDEGALLLRRAARFEACTLPFAVWMALAKTTPVYDDAEPPQRTLVPVADDERP